MKIILKRFLKSFMHIRRIDMFLILFMLILMFESVCSLFIRNSASESTNAIDAIVRTSQAAIFGYFISGNFIKMNSPDSEQSAASTPFQAQSSNIPENILKQREHLQIIVVSSVGIISMVLLVFLRFFTHFSADKTATISQLCDFVSACVGFLVSHKKL